MKKQHLLNILFQTLGLMLLLQTTVWAKPVYNIGILAFRPPEVVLKKWQPLVDELNTKIPDATFKIHAYNFPQLESAVANKTIDFVFTNSANYILLHHRFNNLSPLASLIEHYQNKPLYGFGGVIVLPASSPIKTLQDIKGKTIVTPSKHSLGGYMMQAYQLLQVGVTENDYHVIPVGMPHDKSIKVLLEGKADAAFVRTGVLEQMASSGELKLDQVKVIINPEQTYFPLKTSTCIYPEWPFVKMPHTDENLAGKVAGVLLSMPHNGELAQKLDIYGFRIPPDYQPVRNILQALRAEPYDDVPKFTFTDIWLKYQSIMIAFGVMILIVVILLIMFLVTYRRLLNSHKQLSKNTEDLKLSALSFNSYQPILITNANEEIIKVNPAFTEVFGYTEAEVLGKSPRILSSNEHTNNFYSDIWKHLQTHGFWQGEIWDRRKNGELFPVSTTITTIKNDTGEPTHYQAIYLDITADKALEQHYKNLALADPLTNLANRCLLKDRVEHAIAAANRNRHYYALVHINLDNFKPLNDAYGHHKGDLLLKEIANRIIKNVRSVDTVARIGGDEFVILIEAINVNYALAKSMTLEIVEKLKTIIQEPYQLEHINYDVTASYGITLFSDKSLNEKILMKQADMAMNQAKNEGKNAIHFYETT